MSNFIDGLKNFEVDNLFDLVLDFSSSSRKKIETLKTDKKKLLKKIEESYKSIETLKDRLYNLEELNKILNKSEGFEALIFRLSVIEEINIVKKNIVNLRPINLLDKKMILTHEIEKLTIKSSIWKYLRNNYGD